VTVWGDAELLEPFETEAFDERDTVEERTVCVEPAPGFAVGQRGQVAVGDGEPFSRNGEGVAHVAGDRVRHPPVQGGEVLTGELDG